MITISSRKNESVKATAGLVRSAENRKAQGLFVVEGARLCYDACRSGVTVKQLYFTQQAQEKYGEYLQPLLEQAEEAFLVEPHVAELLSSTKSSQGIYAVCRMEPLRPLAELDPNGKYIGVENLQDPGNLGAVMRTAEALGLQGLVLLGDCCDTHSPKALRAGMGAVFRFPMYYGESFVQEADALHKKGLVTFAAVPDAAAEIVTECAFPKGSLLLVGNEGNGLLPETVATCSHRVTIPMLGRAESLNAAASSAILMWEMVRSGGM